MAPLDPEEFARRYARAQREPKATADAPTDVWERAQCAADLLAGAPDDAIDWIEPNLVAPGAITYVFSPRGLGKSHVAHELAVRHAAQGKRVLLLDRDMSRRAVKQRLRNWGAGGLTTLRVLTREWVPALTDGDPWKTFPLADYDIVVIDAWDSFTEGVGEQDSSRPSRALAVLLDIVRRPQAPGVLVLGNTIKNAKHSRGSGVIEDRADAVYEVRDATDLKPTGKKPWWLELAEAGVDAWAERAARRHRRTVYRLAFVPSKFRLTEEPDPFCLEVRLNTDPWSVADVTADLLAAGQAARDASAHARQAALNEATKALRKLVEDRAATGEVLLKDKEAVPFLMDRGLTRKMARELIEDRNGLDWRVVKLVGRRGEPQILEPISAGPAEPPPDSDLWRPAAAETLDLWTPHQYRAGEGLIFAARSHKAGGNNPPRNPAPVAGSREGGFPPARDP